MCWNFEQCCTMLSNAKQCLVMLKLWAMLYNADAANTCPLPLKPKKATVGQMRVGKRNRCNRRAKKFCLLLVFRVIHSCVVNDKIDIFLLFRPDSESFGKWCLEKCKKIFDTTTLMPAKSIPKLYYITHLC